MLLQDIDMVWERRITGELYLIREGVRGPFSVFVYTTTSIPSDSVCFVDT